MYVDISGDLESTQGGISQGSLKVWTEAGSDLSAHLSINEEGTEPTQRCAYCGEESTDDEPDEGECPGSGKYGTCPTCNGTNVCGDCDGTGTECPQCDGECTCGDGCDEGQIEIHQWESIPLHWCNSASIHAEPDRDRVRVTISVDDPRGAFCMDVERDSDGQLWLYVPHADMSSPHAPLTQRGPGWFKVR